MDEYENDYYISILTIYNNYSMIKEKINKLLLLYN